MRKTLITIFFGFILSVPMLSAKDGESLEFDRGIDGPNTLFIPKGTVGLGASFSYNTYDVGKIQSGDSGFSFLGSLLNDVRGSFKSFTISPNSAYFIADNVSVGGLFQYKHTDLNLANAGLSLGDDLSFGVEDMFISQNNYSISGTARYYIPIANSKRFALFMEGRLGLDLGQSKNYKLENTLKHGVFQETIKASLDAVSGICVFVSNEVAFEVQVGVMGMDITRSRQIENQVDVRYITGSNANFKVNLLSLSFGTYFFILDRHHKPKKA